MEKKILQVLFQYPAGKKKNEVAVLAGYAQSGSFSNALSGLRTKKMMISEGDLLMGTTLAAEYAHAVGIGSLPVGDALLQHWMGELGLAERTVLQFLVDTYPVNHDKAAIAEGCGYKVSGSFSNTLSRLRVLGLITNGKMIQASDILFDNAEAA